MGQNKSPHRRKYYFIKRDFQLKFIIKFCLVVLIGVAIATGLLLLFSQDTLTSSFNQSRLEIKSTALAIFPTVLYTNLITLGLITLATIAVMLFISHKLAGPLFRFEKEIEVIGEGDLTRAIKLRKEDQIIEMADSLNRMSTQLREKLLGIQADLTHIIESASKRNRSDKLIDDLKDLHHKIETSFKI